MSDTDKNIVSKLEIIKEMAVEASVKQLSDVMIQYVKSQSKGNIGFSSEDKK